MLRTGDDPEPKGMIRVTTFCLKPGDPPPSGEQQEGTRSCHCFFCVEVRSAENKEQVKTV